jgi:hypothetical protein
MTQQNEVKEKHKTMYKIILDDVFPQCLAYKITADECKKKLAKFREEMPKMASSIRAFTVDGDSVYW